MVILNKILKFFETKCGWFFVNGSKIESWNSYLKTKYPNEIDTVDRPRDGASDDAGKDREPADRVADAQ